MVGRRGEAPLVPPYSFRRPNKAMALRHLPHTLFVVVGKATILGVGGIVSSFSPARLSTEAAAAVRE